MLDPKDDEQNTDIDIIEKSTISGMVGGSIGVLFGPIGLLVGFSVGALAGGYLGKKFTKKHKEDKQQDIRILEMESYDSFLLRIKKSESTIKELEQKIENANKLLVDIFNKLESEGIDIQIQNYNTKGLSNENNYRKETERKLRFLEKLDSMVTCPISLETILADHVMADDGHSYSRESLQKHYDTRKNDIGGARCPLDRKKSLTNPKELQPSFVVDNLIKYFNCMYGSYEKFKEKIQNLKNKLLYLDNKVKTSNAGIFKSKLNCDGLRVKQDFGKLSLKR